MLKDKQMQQPIVFFDGVCNLCNGFVDWLFRHDTRGQIYVAPLQGKTAQSLLPAPLQQKLGTVVFYYQGQTFERSDAVLKILGLLPPPWRWLTAGKYIPLRLRDTLYDWVARHRYQWFGRRETCRLPTPTERSRFLD
jgi:predicted DCC family thiol-disulfide oxidoreductase YuxK